ncbi:hypothetical protein [Neisseria montereyensis]|uniref:Transcriptional regulator n=1 Tax=Neisseria montereyensis TaxID=2973938 RepID=A0ABT2FB49_9NEIS|nr:hypothetical protein [Neisseria montereyensis]MCS4532964.1 hypothetical protein [Neisseria montereyensis]
MKERDIFPEWNFEVALEVLGDSMRPFIQEREEERQKDKPNQAYIDYLTRVIQAIDLLRDELSPDDEELIEKIFDHDFKIVGTIK